MLKQQTLTGFERYAKTTRRAQFLADMQVIVPWAELTAVVEPFVLSEDQRSGWPTAGAARANVAGVQPAPTGGHSRVGQSVLGTAEIAQLERVGETRRTRVCEARQTRTFPRKRATAPI